MGGCQAIQLNGRRLVVPFSYCSCQTIGRYCNSVTAGGSVARTESRLKRECFQRCSDMQELAARYHAAQLALYRLLEAVDSQNAYSKAVRGAILLLIAANVCAVILESSAEIERRWAETFQRFEVFSVFLFSVEYLVRLWVCVVDPRYKNPVSGRVRFALTPYALIDLVSILPAFVTIIPIDLRFLRSIRMLRVFRLLKAGRYSRTVSAMGGAIRDSKEELSIALLALSVLLLISSGLMYFAEREAQPQVFTSIPATMWWSVTTLTTIGYGDMVPVTVFGCMLAGAISVLGIGVFALPAGIMAAAFARQAAARRRPSECPHCGKRIGGD